MASEKIKSNDVPPPGEPIHLPGPSYLPVLTAAGLAIAICGVVINWFMFAVGIVVAVLAIGRWIIDTRRDISELPLEHETH